MGVEGAWCGRWASAAAPGTGRRKKECRMGKVCEMLQRWMFTYGYKRGFLGSLKPVKGWKWPTKGELLQLTGMDEEEFEAELDEEIGWRAVRVRNGRVGLTSAPVDVGTGEATNGEF